LNEKTKKLLGEMLRNFKISGRTKLLKGQDKTPAARAILDAAEDYVPMVEIPEEAEFVLHFFLKPVDKGSKSQKALEVGKQNEINVLMNLKKFMEKSHLLHLSEIPREYGLVSCKSKPYLATSVDGLIFNGQLSLDGGST
jgi:hypothetical protein